MSDEGVYRVQFSPLCGDDPVEADQFREHLKALGGMVVYGSYPGPVVIGIPEDALDAVEAFPLVRRVESVGENVDAMIGDYAVGG